MNVENTPLPHGGDWAGYLAEYGTEALDFSANVSPLGLPAGVKNAILQSLSHADRYPDPLCRALSYAIAAREQVLPEQILCGNGAADLIFRLVLAVRPQTALIPVPTFSEYAAALHLAHSRITYHPLSEAKDFALDETFLSKITSETEMVFLCLPNNPTGRSCSPELLTKVLERCEAVGAVLVVDACFSDFVEHPVTEFLTKELTAHPKLVILKAFTKFYAMAGIRLGYCICGDPQLLEQMRLAGAPWAVSSVAQAAGIAALQEQRYAAELRNLIRTERETLYAGLETLGLRVIPGEANFLLFRSPAPLLEPLRERGILLRSCENFLGLDASWYRTAVRTQTENRRLLQALKEILP